MDIRRATLTGSGFTAARFTFDADSRRFVTDWTPDGRPVLSPPADTVERFFGETRPDLRYVEDAR